MTSPNSSLGCSALSRKKNTHRRNGKWQTFATITLWKDLTLGPWASFLKYFRKLWRGPGPVCFGFFLRTTKGKNPKNGTKPGVFHLSFHRPRHAKWEGGFPCITHVRTHTPLISRPF